MNRTGLTPADQIDENPHPDDFAVTFEAKGRIVGRLVEQNGVVRFEGNIDDSAAMFFTRVIEIKNQRLVDMAAQINQMHLYQNALEMQLRDLQGAHPGPN